MRKWAKWSRNLASDRVETNSGLLSLLCDVKAIWVMGLGRVCALRTQLHSFWVPDMHPHLKMVRRVPGWLLSQAPWWDAWGQGDTWHRNVQKQKGAWKWSGKNCAFLFILRGKKMILLGDCEPWNLSICLLPLCPKRSQKKCWFLKWHKIYIFQKMLSYNINIH